MTYEKPLLKDSILTIGNLGSAKVLGGNDIVIEEIPITDSRLKLAWKHNIYRIRITAQSDSLTLIIK